MYVCLYTVNIVIFTCIEAQRMELKKSSSSTMKKKIPSGIMLSVNGSVSRYFLPYLSDRFPIKGVITIIPNPMICIIIRIPFIARYIEKLYNQLIKYTEIL